jgi:hypothetical protein
MDITDINAPTAALRYTRSLARREIPATARVGAYRLGEMRFVRTCMAELLGPTAGDHSEALNGRSVLSHAAPAPTERSFDSLRKGAA